MSKITVVPSQISYEACDDETILAAALRHGINLPHACQGGVCGTCRARLVEGNVSQCGEYDDYVLSEQEKQGGMILLCCRRAVGDVVLDMPAYAGSKSLTIHTLPARISAIDIRGDVAIMKITLSQSLPFRFYAGQYVDVLLKEGNRSYSLANSPNETQELEFHVRRREGGLFSPQLFNGQLDVGSIIRLRGPLGAFMLNENSTKSLIFLANGTGWAPIKSLLSDLAQHQAHRSVHIYLAHQSNRDFYDDTALQTLLTKLPNARYTSVSHFDLVQQILMDYPDLSRYEVYACGTPEMVVKSCSALVNQGKLPKEMYFSEMFHTHI